MTDPWEPTAADRAAYAAAARASRQGGVYASLPEVADAGLRAAYASLRARVGGPATAELVRAGDEPVEYRAFYNPDELIAAAADGWRFLAQCWDAAGDPYGLMQRSAQPAHG